jgi:hypothetical protein
VQEYRLQRLVDGYRNAWVLTDPSPAELQSELPKLATAALGKPLTDAERQQFASTAALWLRRIAVGELPGYDLAPAESAILHALNRDDLAPLLIEAAGRLPGREPQRALARVVLDDQRPAEVRAAAADQLVRHVQQYSAVLLPEQARGLLALYATTDDPRLKVQLARVLGSLRPSPRVTGERLQQYAPAPPMEGAPGR